MHIYYIDVLCSALNCHITFRFLLRSLACFIVYHTRRAATIRKTSRDQVSQQSLKYKEESRKQFGKTNPNWIISMFTKRSHYTRPPYNGKKNPLRSKKNTSTDLIVHRTISQRYCNLVSVYQSHRNTFTYR